MKTFNQWEEEEEEFLTHLLKGPNLRPFIHLKRHRCFPNVIARAVAQTSLSTLFLDPIERRRYRFQQECKNATCACPFSLVPTHPMPSKYELIVFYEPSFREQRNDLLQHGKPLTEMMKMLQIKSVSYPSSIYLAWREEMPKAKILIIS